MARHSDNLEGYAAIGFCVGIYMFFKGFRELRKYRLIEDTPAIPIRSIPMGFVQIQGKAEGERPIPSPISHTPCLAYKVVIDKWKHDSQNRSSGWSHDRTDVDGVKFYLSDSGGKVLVDVHGAELDLPQTARREVASGSAVNSGPGATNEELLRYVTQAEVHSVTGLMERGLEKVGPLQDSAREEKRQALMGVFKHTPGSADFRGAMATMMAGSIKQYVENLPPQADPNHEQARQAMLEAFQHPTGSPEFLEAVKRAQAAAPDVEPLQRLGAMLGQGAPGPAEALGTFGMNAASGRYRLTEYCLVPGGVYDISGTCAENPNPRDEHDRNIIVKGSNEKTYLISSRTGRQVETGLRNRALKMILGGAAISLICLAIILWKVGLL